jgi:hypothetical protein
MKPWPQPSGLSSGLAFTIDSTWEPEQALAVWELLDDLRERIWTHYGGAIQDLLRQQRVSTEPFDDCHQDLPF